MEESKKLHGQVWASKDERKAAADIAERRASDAEKGDVTFRQWWSTAYLSKTAVFWSWLGVALLTGIVGFTLGGWVSGGTAQKMADVAARNAVVARLAPICVAQFNLDPAKAQNLTEMKALNGYEWGSYIAKHTWAIMPGEEKATSGVADACAKLIQASQ